MENILFLFIQFILFLSLGVFWYKLLKWSPEESMCMAVMCIITTVLIGGSFGCAQIALIIVNFLSVLGLLLFVGGRRIKILGVNKQKSMAFFSPGIILIILIFFYGVVAFWGLEICNWDELHQWAKSVVFMINKNALPMGPDFDGQSVLLSATTLFHYYFCKLTRVVTHEIIESNMYVSNLVLWFSAVVLPLSNLGWKNWKKCFCYAITIFLSMNILFIQPYYNIYCDQPVTMWAGAMIAWVIFCEKKKYQQLLIVLAILNISFMKNMMGPLFSIIILIVLFIQYLSCFDLKVKDKIKAVMKDLTIKKIIYGIICCVSIFLVTILWSLRISENALIRGVGSVRKDGGDRFKLTIKSGISKWFQAVNLNSAFPTITFFVFLIFVILIGYIVINQYLTGKKKKIYQSLIILYIIGFFGYFTLMIYTYMTTFSYEDSIVTGSLNRYFSDYILLGLIPILMPIYMNYVPRKGKTNVLAVVLLVFFSVGTTQDFANKSLGWVHKEGENYIERCEFNSYKKDIKKLMDTDEKIYMINQNENAYFTVVADYELDLLLDRSGMCYYFSKENKSIAGLSQVGIRVLPEILLNDYGYLWIYKSDNYFDDKAFDILRIKQPSDGDFYKVVNQNGRLWLQYLGNIQKD